MRIFVFVAMLLGAVPALALEIVPVADDVYAIVGDFSQRSPENLGNNATFGVVVTGDGVVLVDAGGSAKGAAEIEAMIKTVTDQPVKIVLNTGGQDHRWLGNGYFKARGARVIASAQAVADQRERVNDQLQGLEFFIGKDNLAGTEPVYADQTFDDAQDFELSGVRFEMRHTGGAHTPGDAFVWLPGKEVMFTGDIVYLERILGVSAVSNSANWVETFKAMADYQPKVIVPGHGRPGDLVVAKKQTLDYLLNLRSKMRAVLDRGGQTEDGVAVDQSAFSGLQNFEGLARRNALAVFIEMEFD